MYFQQFFLCAKYVLFNGRFLFANYFFLALSGHLKSYVCTNNNFKEDLSSQIDLYIFFLNISLSALLTLLTFVSSYVHIKALEWFQIYFLK